MSTEQTVQYCIGDQLVHPGHGGCAVVATKRMQMSGKDQEYYVLQPFVDKGMSVYVPVDKVDANRIRALMPRSSVQEILDSLHEQDEPWISDQKKRQLAYGTVFQEEDLVKQAGVLKMLIDQDKIKTLTGTTLDFLRHAKQILLSEFAMSMGTDFENMNVLFEKACHKEGDREEQPLVVSA